MFNRKISRDFASAICFSTLAAWLFTSTPLLSQVVNPGVPVSGSPANNDCTKFVVSGGNVKSITTTGTACATGGITPANPAATAGPNAINGSATTYMRSDAAPAVQLASTSVFGIVEADGSGLCITMGVISLCPSISTAITWGSLQTFGSGTFFSPGDYGGGTTNATLAALKGSTGTPSSDGDATVVVENVSSAAVAYANVVGLRITAAGAKGQSSTSECSIPNGGTGVFCEGGRFTTRLFSGTSAASAYGAISNAYANNGTTSYTYLIAHEAEVDQWVADAPTAASFNPSNIAVSYNATCGNGSSGQKKCDAAYLVNPNSNNYFRTGYFVPANNSGFSVDTDAFANAASLFNGFNASYGTYSGCAFKGIGFCVDGSGNISAAIGLIGTSTNNNATAGYVGEFITSGVGISTSMTSGAWANITSISLPAGDWDVWGNVGWGPALTTTVQYLYASITTVSGTGSTNNNGAGNTGTIMGFTAVGNVFPQFGNPTQSVGVTRMTLATTTTIYLEGLATFGTSTLSSGGFIAARRVR